MIEPRPEIAAMPAYSPGRSRALVQQETGRSDIVKLASNESLWGPSPRAIAQASQVLADVFQYPEVQPLALREALAEQHDLQADQILVSNGADEVLRVVAQCYVSPGESIVFPRPSFAAYAFAAALVGARGIAVPLTSSGINDVHAMVRAIAPDTKLLYLCTPNNPTGGAITQSDWDWLLAHVPDRVLIVVDSAYEEFNQAPDSPRYLDAVRQGRPVVIAHTFSKLYGLAGLRVGWAAAPPSIVRTLQKGRDPFSLNAVGAEAALAALQDRAYYARVLEETWRARQLFLDALRSRRVTHYPTQANFVTFRVPDDAEQTARAFEQHGFVVRPTTSFGLPYHVRVTIAPAAVMTQFLAVYDRLVPSR
jgi:histidinol-phosphate aminotransferase